VGRQGLTAATHHRPSGSWNGRATRAAATRALPVQDPGSGVRGGWRASRYAAPTVALNPLGRGREARRTSSTRCLAAPLASHGTVERGPAAVGHRIQRDPSARRAPQPRRGALGGCVQFRPGTGTVGGWRTCSPRRPVQRADHDSIISKKALNARQAQTTSEASQQLPRSGDCRTRISRTRIAGTKPCAKWPIRSYGYATG